MKRRNFIRTAATGTLAATSGLALASFNSETNTQAKDDAFRFTREIPKDKVLYDVIIAGGGPAGVGAALSAARLGASVLLIEATGCLGGMGTSALVTSFDPISDGEKLLQAGILLEIIDKMYARGFLGPNKTPDAYKTILNYWTPFHAEGYKLLLDELTTEAGVEVRFFTRVIEVDAEAKKGIVNGIIQQNIEGMRYVKAKAYIDCTGDAVLTHLCGAPCREAGKDTPGIMAPTLCSYHANIDFSKAVGVSTNSKLLEKAIADGHFSQVDRHLPGMARPGQTIGYLNGGHLFEVDALNCKSLSEGMKWGRRMVQEFVSFYRKYVPGFENMELVATASVMGVRESRRIVGEYELNIDDYMKRREFPDQIGVHNKAVDIHGYDKSDEQFQRYSKEYANVRFKKGECSGMPYSMLVPKGWRNLWAAGRCNSSDISVNGAIRAQATCIVMGQGAGTAAVQSIKTGQPANDLDTEMLVTTLREAGAYLPQKTLSKTMTRI